MNATINYVNKDYLTLNSKIIFCLYNLLQTYVTKVNDIRIRN